MIRKTLTILCILLFTIVSLRVQAEGGLLIKGHVSKGGNDILSIKCGKELGFFSIRIQLDASGNFEYWIPKRSQSEYLSIVCGDEQVAFYVLDMDSVSLTWSKDHLFKSLEIRHNTTVPDTALKNWIVNRIKFEEEKYDALDNCENSQTYFSVMQQLYHREYDLLKKYGKSFSDEIFNRYATDIFYGNMHLIVNSKHFKEFDFSSDFSAQSFPPITMLNKKLEEALAANWEIRKRNIVIDSVRTRNLSDSEVLGRFRNVSNPQDLFAFEKTYAYKQYIRSYISDLASQIYNRRLQPAIRSSSVQGYSDWLNTLYLDKRIIKWLIATKIENNIIQDESLPESELAKQIEILAEPDLARELLEVWTLQNSLRKGDQAPNFSFVTVNGRIGDIKQFRGKYIYLNFWDSSCAPCVSDIVSYSKKVSEHYKNKNVVFLNVSLDKDQEAWKKSLAKYNASGTNVRVSEGWSGLPVKLGV